jgi:hypothetical protein
MIPSITIFVQIFLRQKMDTIQWISFDKKVLHVICYTNMLKAALDADDWTAHLCVCLQVYRQGDIQRYDSWYWYVMPHHIYHPPPWPLQRISHRPLHYGQGMCMKTIIKNSFFHSHLPTKTKVWILLCVLFIICIMTILGIYRLHPPYNSDDYNRKSVLSPCTAKSFWLWIQRTSTHQHININTLSSTRQHIIMNTLSWTHYPQHININTLTSTH